MLRRHRLLARLAPIVLLGSLATATATSTSGHLPAEPGVAHAAVGSDQFMPGEPYNGEFPDPHITRYGDVYYAAATNTSGNNLPIMTSTDLETWTPRDGWPTEAGYSDWWGYNDAMPTMPDWAAKKNIQGKLRNTVWAPSLAKVGARYLAAYSVAVAHEPKMRMCISVASSADPLGPYVDKRSKPLVCSSDPGGSIDPHWFQSGDKTWLLWKDAGLPGSHPTRIWTRRVGPNGTSFLKGSKKQLLLATAQTWENNVIENPAMIRYAGKHYLFYSGDNWNTRDYAIGYAICDTPVGPCRRPLTKPLLARDAKVDGPGGGTPFVGLDGELKLGYAAWKAGRVGYPTDTSCEGAAAGCNQRRLYLATLSVRANGTLTVADRD